MSGTVVGSAWLGAGNGVGAVTGITGAGTNPDPGVNAIGGSKRAKLGIFIGSVNNPVHNDAQAGSRER